MKSISGTRTGRKAIAVFLSAALVITMSLSVTTVSFAGAFSDLNGSPYETVVEKLAEQSIISGYPDGSFKPGNPISREEICAVVTRAMGPSADKLNDAKDCGYSDVSEDSWAYESINYASAMGVITGYEDKTFKPSANVTYNELSAMLVRGCGFDEDDLAGSWPDNYRIMAEKLGIYTEVLNVLEENGDADLNYNAPATRGDAALMVSAVLERLQEEGKKALPASSTKAHIYNDGRYEWIDGDGVSLSLIKAVSLMQTEGVLADTANANKAADEAKLAKYKENIADVDDGIQQLKDKKAELQETLQTINETLAKKKLLLVAAFFTGKYSDTKSQFEEAEESIPTIQDGIAEIEKQIPELEFSRGLAVRQRDFCEANIDNNNKAELNAIESQAVSLYYGVLQARENLKVNEDNLEVQNDLMDIINLKYEVGTVAKIEVKAQEAAVIQAEQTVKEAKAALEKAIMSFNILLGNDVQTNISLTDSLAAVKFPSKSVEEYIGAAKANRLTVLAVDYGCEMAALNLNHLDGKEDTDKSGSDYLTAQNTVKTLENSKDALLKNLEIEVRSAYIDMLNKYDAVESANKTAELAQDGYAVKRLMYENGMATMADVREAQISVYQANQLVMASIAAYNIAVSDFGFIVGIGKDRIDL